MSTSRSRLTTTSYAILGLLAVRPWTAYELTRQMQRSLSRFWPRAASKLYEEPRKLAALGLAGGSAETVGRRARTRWAVTPEGRRELARWLAEPGAGPVLEFEALLKVFLAEHGTREDLLRTLSGVQAWARQRTADDAAIAAGYLAGAGAFPERAAVLVLVGRYLSDLGDMTGRWASWATEVVEQWPDDVRLAEPAWETLAEVAARGKAG